MITIISRVSVLGIMFLGFYNLPIRAADLPTGPSPMIPPDGKAPGDYPNFTVTAANWTIDANAVDDIHGDRRDDIKMNIDGQGPLPWSLTEFQQGHFAPRLNVFDPQAASSNLGVIPFDITDTGSGYEWENDILSWAPNGAAWRPHPNKGVLLASIRKNGQQWNDGQPRFYGIASTPILMFGGEGYSMLDGSFGSGDIEISIQKIGSASAGSVDTSVAWFPYDQGWIGGYVASPDFREGEWFDEIFDEGFRERFGEGFHHPDLPSEASEIINWTLDFSIPIPPAILQIPNVDSRNDGMLFTMPIQSSLNVLRFTAADPKPDGNGWEVMIRDNNDFDDFLPERSIAFSFLYIPYDSNDLIGGQVRGRDGNILNGRGNYSVERLDEGQYEIAIPGKSSHDGMLILGTAGRFSGEISRSFLSYEPTPEGKFIVESRFFQSDDEQPLEDSDFYFAWIDFAKPLSPPGFQSSIEPPFFTNHPEDQNVEIGASVTFLAEVSGVSPFLFQWLKNGEPIENANQSSFMIQNASLEDAGHYALESINAGGKSTSQPARLKVLAPPDFISQPQSIDASTGDAVRFSVEVSGTPPLLFQWQKNGIDLPNATNAELVLQNISLEDAGQYRVLVSNEVRSTFSTSARLTIRATLSPPSLRQQPVSQEVSIGDSVSFRVVAFGSPPLSFQWQKNGENLPGQINDVLSIASAQESDQGEYRVIISNAAGNITSAIATLNVLLAPLLDPPLILQQPASLSVEAGQSVRFQVFVVGQRLSFQWFKNGESITNAIDATFQIPTASHADEGEYWVEIHNPSERIRSATAILNVLPLSEPLQILAQPQSQSIAPGTDVTFSVLARGDGTLTYQWQRDAFNIPGARDSSFSISNVQSIDAGNYRVIISDNNSSIQSDIARLIVSLAPVILIQPQSQSIPKGEAVAFGVEARGQSPLQYQWQFNGINIPGARDRVFSIDAVQEADAGNYRVIISDDNTSIQSDIARLIVTSVSPPMLLPLVIEDISIDGNTLKIQWRGEPGVVLQAKAALSDPFWQDVPGSEGKDNIQQLTLGKASYFRLIRR